MMDFASRIKKIVFNRVFHHGIFWSVIFTGIIIINRSDNFLMITTPNLFIFCIFLPFPVYLHFFLLEKFFNRKKPYLYLTFLIILVPLFAMFFRSLFTEKMQQFNGLFVFIINLTIFLVITTGLKFLKSNFKQKIQIQQQKTNQLQAEMERIRSGINPRFMKKVLDYLYIQSFKKSPQIPYLILQFSAMLRNTIEDSRKKEVNLSRELHNIKEYLNLEHQISRHRISVKKRGSLKKKIVPLLLVSLIEKILFNVNQLTSNPVSGEILINADEKNIFFSLKINKLRNFKYGFMDINAIESRLRKYYSNNYLISKKNYDNSATLDLQITPDRSNLPDIQKNIEENG